MKNKNVKTLVILGTSFVVGSFIFSIYTTVQEIKDHNKGPCHIECDKINNQEKRQLENLLNGIK